MRFLVVFFAIFFISNVSAFQYPIPVFLNSESGYENGEKYVILGHPTIIEGGEWAGSKPQRQFANVGLFSATFNAWAGGSGVMNSSVISTKSYRTRSDAFMAVYKKDLARPHVFNSKRFFNTPVLCIGYVEYTNPTGTITYDALSLPGVCPYVKPLPAQCMIITPTIILDHKLVSQDTQESSKAEVDFVINCSLEGKVKFSLSGEDSIPLGKGKSTIKINNLPLKSDINVNYGNNTLKVSSSLSGVEPGNWQGSAVLVFEQY